MIQGSGQMTVVFGLAWLGVLIVVIWLLIRRGKTPNANKSLSIQDRNRDIITRHENAMPLIDARSFVESVTASCLREIAKAERRDSVAPRSGEYPSKWRSRADIPTEFRELAQYLEERFQGRIVYLKLYHQKTQEQGKERHSREYSAWLYQHRVLVNKFLEVAERKISLLDDYGDENWDALPKEIETCMLKIVKTDNTIIRTDLPKTLAITEALGAEKYQWVKAQLEAEFRSFHEKQRQQPAGDPEFTNFSGTDFETYLAKVLKENGFEDVRGTSVTGDQGADLIAKKNNKTIVIQAKRYQGSVGNGAVQEVVGAVNFYGADEGWVVTSGTFTPSAKALAQKSHVKLIDGYALRTRRLF